MNDLRNENLQTDIKCVLCGSRRLFLAKKGNVTGSVGPQHFMITDSNYGKTFDIFSCLECGLLQCSLIRDTRLYYEKLEDDQYEEGRDARAVQMKKILNLVAKYRPGGKLLDIGAASGILVEQALKMGYRAKGIEPSRRFAEEAEKRNLPVHFGTFPHPDITGLFDVITLIDVLEHIPDPLEMLKGMSVCLGRNGVGVAVTPDVESLAVRLMGWKWWHFRAAHIVYFSRKTLLKALNRAGLKPISIRYTGWVFPMDYLFDRLMEYVPPAIRLRPKKFMKKVMIPLNLLDSLIVIFKNK